MTIQPLVCIIIIENKQYKDAFFKHALREETPKQRNTEFVFLSLKKEDLPCMYGWFLAAIFNTYDLIRIYNIYIYISYI